MINAVIERCVGIDVGKKFLCACVMTGPASGEAQHETRPFGTTAAELEKLRQWVEQQGCTHAVMESTGAYWKPIFNVLEGTLKVALANPHEVKARKGHKTDPKDAWWLAHLLRHAMITPSFIPARPQRELRDLTRRRKKLIQAATSEKNRVEKVLEDANVKLGTVLSDVFGVSGQLMLHALLEGSQDAQCGGGYGDAESAQEDPGDHSRPRRAPDERASPQNDSVFVGAPEVSGATDCGFRRRDPEENSGGRLSALLRTVANCARRAGNHRSGSAGRNGAGYVHPAVGPRAN
jgi:hypothetical protein